MLPQKNLPPLLYISNSYFYIFWHPCFNLKNIFNEFTMTYITFYLRTKNEKFLFFGISHNGKYETDIYLELTAILEISLT